MEKIFSCDPTYGYECFINDGGGITIKQASPMGNDAIVALSLEESKVLRSALYLLICQIEGE